MTPLVDDDNRRTKLHGERAGQLQAVDGDRFTQRFAQELDRGTHRKGTSPSAMEAVDSSTERHPQQLPSPCPSGDDTDHTPSQKYRGWSVYPLSTPKRKRAIGVHNEDDDFQANGTESALSAGPHSKLAVTQSPNGLVTNRDGDPTNALASKKDGMGRVRKLSSTKMYELTTSPQPLPLHSADNNADGSPSEPSSATKKDSKGPNRIEEDVQGPTNGGYSEEGADRRYSTFGDDKGEGDLFPTPQAHDPSDDSKPQSRHRTHSPPVLKKRRSTKVNGSVHSPGLLSHRNLRSTPTPLSLEKAMSTPKSPGFDGSMPSPMPSTGLPAPSWSLSTYLQLELSMDEPTTTIYRSNASKKIYESSAIKIERLQNFLLLPPQLEQVLWFGSLACLDAWLYSFTILPLRFLKALYILVQSWVKNAGKEIRFIGGFIYAGAGRMWQRRRRKSSSANASSVDISQFQDGPPQSDTQNKDDVLFPHEKESNGIPGPRAQPGRRRRGSTTYRRHRRTKSRPSALRPEHKADILKGFLILISCTILMYFDASRMYHGIRGQAAIKLYVIYNVLEVCDRLFSAIGQDVLECLFSEEALERKPDGRSKVLRPLWLFMLALMYNLVHATALFYQVITLNVAVNSYSNALLTLLMSNQFVEIKSTVFKKFEKDNLFQLTCADVVERFQLWLMLTIIAARNIIETGGLSLSNNNSTPLIRSSILPKSFTIFPFWTGQIMGPFLLVLGSEMLVDWIKHAYITKFNLIKPAIYGRFLDVLAKDYYSNAFADQNLTRRLGLPVIPLSCLFIRASVQTYHMFLATHMPVAIPSTATSLSAAEETTSCPATTAALHHVDNILRRTLGRSTFGGRTTPSGDTTPYFTISAYLTTDDVIAFSTMLLFFLLLFLLLLALKLVLGMCLLSFARRRYMDMKKRESENSICAEGKRVGGWGVVEVDEDKRRWIYMDDPEGARRLREREKMAADRSRDGCRTEEGFEGVERYKMVAKRIW